MYWSFVTKPHTQHVLVSIIMCTNIFLCLCSSADQGVACCNEARCSHPTVAYGQMCDVHHLAAHTWIHANQSSNAASPASSGHIGRTVLYCQTRRHCSGATVPSQLSPALHRQGQNCNWFLCWNLHSASETACARLRKVGSINCRCWQGLEGSVLQCQRA